MNTRASLAMDLLQNNYDDFSLGDGWRVRESSRARNLRIQVFPHGGVEIVVPPRTSKKTVQGFINEHRDWIVKTRAEFLDRRQGETLLPEEIVLQGIGETLRVVYLNSESSRVRQNGDDLLVFVANKTPEDVWPVLQGWLKRKARSHLSNSLTALSRETRLFPSGLQVRLQKTRWGSCSPRGTLSLNAAVLLRPPEELRYVIIHELCHLQHMNHSRRFWQLVERFEPDYRAIDRQLAAAWECTPMWLSV
jgi:predicted metal-dependent hydrolase